MIHVKSINLGAYPIPTTAIKYPLLINRWEKGDNSSYGYWLE